MAAHIIYQCPACQTRQVSTPEPDTGPVRCEHCDWSRDEGAGDFLDQVICRCRICGCDDLWRQKDFPPALGLAIVGVAASLSCLAWAWYRPVTALVILLIAAFLDMLLFTFMGDMLVCYRCASRHRRSAMNEEHPRFNLEISERYRQQALQKERMADR